LTIAELEKWRSKRLNDGVKAKTINNAIVVLKAALNWGMKQGLFEKNQIQSMDKTPERDSKHILRYLDEDERKRLEVALIAREERIHSKTEQPHTQDEFADYLRPAVLLSLNTGIRRGTLLSLIWNDIDFNARAMTIRGEVSKNDKTTRVPLNDDAVDVLLSWREQSKNTDKAALIFPSPKTGNIMNEIQTAWRNILKAAKIENFRWHDLRHSFASELVMKGVDLNTVRELLCHSDMKMTMRYAHLSPESKLNAVQILNRRVKEKINSAFPYDNPVVISS
jgi:integrase